MIKTNWFSIFFFFAYLGSILFAGENTILKAESNKEMISEDIACDFHADSTWRDTQKSIYELPFGLMGDTFIKFAGEAEKENFENMLTKLENKEWESLEKLLSTYGYELETHIQRQGYLSYQNIKQEYQNIEHYEEEELELEKAANQAIYITTDFDEHMGIYYIRIKGAEEYEADGYEELYLLFSVTEDNKIKADIAGQFRSGIEIISSEFRKYNGIPFLIQRYQYGGGMGFFYDYVEWFNLQTNTVDLTYFMEHNFLYNMHPFYGVYNKKTEIINSEKEKILQIFITQEVSCYDDFLIEEGEKYKKEISYTYQYDFDKMRFYLVNPKDRNFIYGVPEERFCQIFLTELKNAKWKKNEYGKYLQKTYCDILEKEIKKENMDLIAIIAEKAYNLIQSQDNQEKQYLLFEERGWSKEEEINYYLEKELSQYAIEELVEDIKKEKGEEWKQFFWEKDETAGKEKKKEDYLAQGEYDEENQIGKIWVKSKAEEEQWVFILWKDINIIKVRKLTFSDKALISPMEWEIITSGNLVWIKIKGENEDKVYWYNLKTWAIDFIEDKGERGEVIQRKNSMDIIVKKNIDDIERKEIELKYDFDICRFYRIK